MNPRSGGQDRGAGRLFGAPPIGLRAYGAMSSTVGKYVRYRVASLVRRR
jgi:hypothetical protein